MEGSRVRLTAKGLGVRVLQRAISLRRSEGVGWVNPVSWGAG